MFSGRVCQEKKIDFLKIFLVASGRERSGSGKVAKKKGLSDLEIDFSRTAYNCKVYAAMDSTLSAFRKMNF